MADTTIYGRVDWSDSGKIKFGSPDCDDRYTCIAQDIEGCIEWEGAHAGEVKITITGAEGGQCNNTYYGCVNWTTGRFEIDIPDNCCSTTTIEYGDDCSECWGAGLTPAYYYVDMYNDNKICFGVCDRPGVDGNYTLHQNPVLPCQWRWQDGLNDHFIDLHVKATGTYFRRGRNPIKGYFFYHTDSTNCRKTASGVANDLNGYSCYDSVESWYIAYGCDGNIDWYY